MHRAGPRKKPLAAVEKRVPRNPKYAEIKARIDSGLTMDKIRVVTTREYLRRRHETFYRLSTHQLYELLSEYEAESYEDLQGTKQAYDGPKIVTHEVEDSPQYEKPYLILDVRSPQDFEDCHIIQGRNFPSQYLNQDKITADLLRFKNREGNLIILYDEEDRLAGATATQFVEKGFDNVFIVTGGLRAFFHDHPTFVEGQLPLPSSTIHHRSASSSSSTAMTSPRSTTSLCADSLSRLSLSSGLPPPHRRVRGPNSVMTSLATSPSRTRAGVTPSPLTTSRTTTLTRSSLRGLPLGGYCHPHRKYGGGASGSRSGAMMKPAAGAMAAAADGQSVCRMSTQSNLSVADSVIVRAKAKRGSF